MKKDAISRCKAIYRPRGRAGEYSPLAINLYTGCYHSCEYCYVPRCLRIEKNKFHSQIYPRKDIIEKIEHDAKLLAEAGCRDEILLCFTCDPYTPEVQSDPYNMTTRKTIEILSENGLLFQILSKAGTRAIRDFALYKKNDKFATTLTFIDSIKSIMVEPNAALPSERIKTLKMAKEHGIETWVSFEPALDEKQIHILITKSEHYTDFYKIGKVTKYPSAITDWTGFVKRITEHLDAIGKPYMLKEDLKKEIMEI
jgi:DNA repair photolyase